MTPVLRPRFALIAILILFYSISWCSEGGTPFVIGLEPCCNPRGYAWLWLSLVRVAVASSACFIAMCVEDWGLYPQRTSWWKWEIVLAQISTRLFLARPVISFGKVKFNKRLYWRFYRNSVDLYRIAIESPIQSVVKLSTHT
jgi:hypothetical protein